MAASPLPREPLSGTCDAGGNATIKYRAPVHFYIHAYVAIQVSGGQPGYAITLGAASPIVFGQGNQTQLGPILLQPGEVMILTVTGAAAGAVVVAQVMGWQAAQPEDLVPLLPLQPTAILVANTISGPVVVTPGGIFPVNSIPGGWISEELGSFYFNRAMVANTRFVLLPGDSKGYTLAHFHMEVGIVAAGSYVELNSGTGHVIGRFDCTFQHITTLPLYGMQVPANTDIGIVSTGTPFLSGTLLAQPQSLG